MNIFTIVGNCAAAIQLVAYLNQAGFRTLTRNGLGGVGTQVTTDAPPYVVYEGKRHLGLSTVPG
jgi:hypothetical protein